MSPVHIARPYVPRTRSFSRGWIVRSCTATVGRFAFNCVQTPPPSIDTNTPTSLPTIKRSRLLRSCTTTLMGELGRLPLIAVQVLPASVVLYKYGVKSSLRNPFFDTNAVPASYGEANTRLTQRSTGAPAAVSAGVKSVHPPPWFCVRCTFPSSVPTQIVPAFNGASEIVVIVQ